VDVGIVLTLNRDEDSYSKCKENYGL